jgi:hypothetical protein
MEVDFITEVFDIWGNLSNAKDANIKDVFDETDESLDYQKLLDQPRVKFGLVYWNMLQEFIPFTFPTTFYPSKLAIDDAYNATQGNAKELLVHFLKTNTIALLRKPFDNKEHMEIFLSRTVDAFEQKLIENLEFAQEKLKEKIKRRLGTSSDVVSVNSESPYTLFSKLYTDTHYVSVDEIETLCTVNHVTGNRITLHNMEDLKKGKMFIHEAYGHQLMHDVQYVLQSLKSQIFDLDKLKEKGNRVDPSFLKSCPYYHLLTIGHMPLDTSETASPSKICLENTTGNGLKYQRYKNRALFDEGEFSLYEGKEHLKKLIMAGDKTGEIFYNFWGKYMKANPETYQNKQILLTSSSATSQSSPVVIYIDTRPLDFWKKAAIRTSLNSLKPGMWRFLILTTNSSKESYSDEFGEGADIDVEILPSIWERESYDRMMKDASFWKKIIDKGYKGKALFIQDDGILFRQGLENSPAWNYSYVGSPLEMNEMNKSFVGEVGMSRGLNGGLSLRVIQDMYDTCVKHKKDSNILYKNNSVELPEDVFFARHVENAAPRDVAYDFSTEGVFNEHALGMHNAWKYNPNDVPCYFGVLYNEVTKRKQVHNN